MKVIKTNIKAETVEINPREALRNTFQDNRRTYNDNIRKYAKQMKDGIKNGIAKATLVAKFSALVQVLLAKTC